MMQRCLQLAQNGLGTTYPNPLVGCVIVHNGKIIGEGWHQKAGEKHAEINAINSVINKNLLPFSRLYVNLEPCAHFGKTPPCSHAIVKHKIPEVYIGTTDFANHVNGRGIEFLKNHNIKVQTGILEAECLHLNRRFFTNQLENRPYIILKWAETQNQFFAPNNNAQQWISSAYAKQLVHFWRSQENGILVGRKTLEIDQPQLNVRLWAGQNPKKFFLSLKKNNTFFEGFEALSNENKTLSNNIFLKALKNLYKNGTNSLIVEGGAKTLQSFIDFNCWDEARVITSPQFWKEGIKSPKILKFNKKEEINLPKKEHLTIFFNYELKLPKH